MGIRTRLARATLTLVPEVADLLARESPTTLFRFLIIVGTEGWSPLVALPADAGLAASLMLGADGVILGSRLDGPVRKAWCIQRAALAANGDDTIRQKSADIARGYDWPEALIGLVRNRSTNSLGDRGQLGDGMIHFLRFARHNALLGVDYALHTELQTGSCAA